MIKSPSKNEPSWKGLPACSSPPMRLAPDSRSISCHEPLLIEASIARNSPLSKEVSISHLISMRTLSKEVISRVSLNSSVAFLARPSISAA